jgi:adenosylcobinamide-phosphate synthase
MSALSQIEAQLRAFHLVFMDPDRLPLAMAALLITMLIGLGTGPRDGNINSLIFIAFSRIFGPFGDRLDRSARPPADLMFRGFILTTIAFLSALILLRAIEDILISTPYHGIIEIGLLSCLITSGAVWKALWRLYGALEGKKMVPGSYFAIARSARTNLSQTDDFGITRAGLGLSVRIFDKGLIAPLFWYLIFGLPAAFIYEVIASLAWRFGKDGFTKGFGVFPLALERILGFLPNIIAGILITLASLFTPTAAVHKGVLSWFGHKNRAPYAQGGAPLSALAWTLNLSLGGASQETGGSAIRGVWVGPPGASAQNDYRHLRRALYISVTAHIILLAGLSAAYMFLGPMSG